MLITLTNAAKNYLSQLIEDQLATTKAKKLNLRILATHPGTEKANIELSYCEEGENTSFDIQIDCGRFTLYIDQFSEKALKEANIDYIYQYENNEPVGGKLHIKAPFLKVNQNISNNRDNPNTNINFYNNLFDRVKNFLDDKVAPYLARHGGMVQLQAINNIENGVEVVLEFSGGCKGCSMISFTLKNGVEKLLKNYFPEIILVSDATNHAGGGYY